MKVGYHQKAKRSGFTLIELLVVISIIGLLSSIVVASLDAARGRARDAQRLSDMRQIETALELFFNDNGHYPDITTNVGTCNYKVGCKIGVGDQIDDLLSPYISSVPQDPLHDGNVYFYSYDPWHYNCTGNETDCNCSSGAAVVFGFNKAESNNANLRKDTYGGGNQNLCNADYNAALTPVPSP